MFVTSILNNLEYLKTSIKIYRYNKLNLLQYSATDDIMYIIVCFKIISVGKIIAKQKFKTCYISLKLFLDQASF
jgi:hypothetical protein